MRAISGHGKYARNYEIECPPSVSDGKWHYRSGRLKEVYVALTAMDVDPRERQVVLRLALAALAGEASLKTLTKFVAFDWGECVYLYWFMIVIE